MTTLPTTTRERVELTAPASAGSSDVSSSGITVQEVVAILKRRTVLVFFLFLLFGAITVGSWLAAYLYFPLYPGEAFVECVSDKPKPIYTTANEALNQKEFERFVLTQANFVTSPNVLMEVLKTAEVKNTRWFKDHQDRLFLDFEDLVHAGPQRGTNLLRISVQTRSPADPHIIVNQIVEHYLSRAKEFNVGEYRRERDSYQNDLESIVNQISAKQEQLGELQKRLPPGFASFSSNVAAEDYAEAKTSVAQLELATQELEGLYAVYTQPGGAAMSPEDTQFVESDPTIATLANNLFLVEQQLEIESGKLGSAHRDVIRLAQTRDVIEAQLNRLRQQRLDEVVAFRQEQLHAAWQSSQHALLLAREKLSDAVAYMADMDSVVTQYRALSEEIELLKTKREQINDYIGQVSRIIRERAAIRVELRQGAIPPLERSFPRFFLIPAGLALSLVFALALPLLLELLDTSLRTPQDVVRHLRIPLLGVLPDADDEEVDIPQLEKAVHDAPQSMFAEVFRSIRTNLQFTAPSDRQRSIVVTSPRPGDGKTTIACNLAMMLAGGGRRVLLVDANFRRPAIHQIFKIRSPGGGLSSILVGQSTLSDLANKTDIDRLDVLVSGPLPPNPAELVGSDRMVEFIAAATKAYDQVILDTPPVLLASDASVLATRADGAIIVCRARVNSRGIGGRACTLLRRVEAHVFGGILNAAQVRRGGYFREQLRTYYDYRADGDDYGDATSALPRDDAPSPSQPKSEP